MITSVSSERILQTLSLLLSDKLTDVSYRKIILKYSPKD